MTQNPRAAKLNFDETNHVFSFIDDNTSALFVCPICLGPIERPVQAICGGIDEGHRACKACLQKVLVKNRRCPTCDMPCEMGFRDGALERQMKPVQVKCDCCGWHGPWPDRKSHLEVCDEAKQQLGWRCPMDDCPFTAQTEAEVEAHMLENFQEHLVRAQSIVEEPPLHISFGCKDTSQVYLPNLAGFHTAGLPVSGPAFIASKGFLCTMVLNPVEGEGITVELKLLPRRCRPGVFPFEQPFYVLVVDPDEQARVESRLVDFHITLGTRLTDQNINPPATMDTWTGGLSITIDRAQIQAVNRNHLIVKVIVL